MKKFFKDFKAFITKGNIVDLAVAVIIGGAFNKIVTSLVNDIIMPLVSLTVGGKDVTDWKWIIRKAQYDANGNVLVAESALKYGLFIQTVMDFLIIAFTVFLIVKIFKASHKKIQQIGETIITETKEFTKKQIKAFKKLQKKNKKKGIVDTELDATIELAQNPKTSSVTTETPSQIEPEVEPENASSKLDTKTIIDNTQQTEPASNNLYNTELLYVLKEIRDTLKANQTSPKKQ